MRFIAKMHLLVENPSKCKYKNHTLVFGKWGGGNCLKDLRALSNSHTKTKFAASLLISWLCSLFFFLFLLTKVRNFEKKWNIILSYLCPLKKKKKKKKTGKKKAKRNQKRIKEKKCWKFLCKKSNNNFFFFSFLCAFFSKHKVGNWQKKKDQQLTGDGMEE